MQPVTIKNNQFINTNNLLQMILLLSFVVVLIVAWNISSSYYILAFCIPIVMLYFRSQLNALSVTNLKATGKGLFVGFQSSSNEPLQFESVAIQAYWQWPSVLFLKLKVIDGVKPIYLMCVRSRLGDDNFISLLYCISQPDKKVVVQ